MPPRDDQTIATADKIRAELEALGSRNRQQSSSPTPLNAAPSKARYFVIWGLVALGLNAAIVGVLQYSLSNPPARTSTSEAVSSQDTVMELVDDTHQAPQPDLSAPRSAPTPPPAMAPLASTPAKVGTITLNGETRTYALSPAADQYRTYRPRTTTYRPAIVVQPAPATSGATTRTPAASSADSHADVAKEYAYQHFRYSYKVSNNNYEVTSLNITLDETVEVPGWGTRHRTTGTAGIAYYANSGFKRTTRKFAVLTEVKNGQVTATEIDVKY